MSAKCIHELLFKSAETHAERPAFWLRTENGAQPINYGEAATRVRNIASGLVRIGVKPQSTIGIYASNSSDWGIVYMSILAAGGVVVPLDPQLKYLELRAIINKAEMKFLFCSENSYADLMELKAMDNSPLRVISVDSAGVDGAAGKLTLADLEKTREGKKEALPEGKPDSLAVLIFTSGTSGDSKGVMLSHTNIVSDVEAVIQRLKIGPKDRFLSILPLHHTFEATCGLIYPLSIGASIGYAQSLKSADILADIEALEVTVMCGVPLLFEKMYSGIQRSLAKKALTARLYVDLGQRIAGLSKSVFDLAAGKVIFKSLRSRAGLDSIRMFVSGGAAINPEISKFFNNLGVDLLQGYGLTETSPVLSVNMPEDNNYASVGKPLPGVEFKIVEPNDKGIGEVAVKGPMVMMGYYKNEEATRQVMQNGHFLTGDLGYIDTRGHLHITGRKKNVIITPAGKNIYPEEIEALLESSPFISECAVLPRKRSTGEEPVAVIVPDYDVLTAAHDGSRLSDEDVRTIIQSEVSQISGQLADYKRIKDVIVMTEELPKTSSKKVKRYALIDTLKHLGEL